MRFPFFRNRDSVKNGILISIRRTGDGFHPGLFTQGSLTASLGFKRPDEIGITLATIMAKTINEEDIELKRAILKHEEGVDLIPGNIELSGLEVQLSNVLSRELILKEFVDSIREEYEYILIDCAPSLGMMTINALVEGVLGGGTFFMVTNFTARYQIIKGQC